MQLPMAHRPYKYGRPSENCRMYPSYTCFKSTLRDKATDVSCMMYGIDRPVLYWSHRRKMTRKKNKPAWIPLTTRDSCNLQA
jgi:hypothetical protein